MFSSGTVSTTVCPPYRGSIWELGQLTRPRRLGSQPLLPNITMITSTSSSKGRTAVRDKYGSKTPLPTTSPSVSPSTLPTSHGRHRRTSSAPDRRDEEGIRAADRWEVACGRWLSWRREVRRKRRRLARLSKRRLRRKRRGNVQQPGEEGGEDYESMTYVSLSPRRSDHILFVLLPMVGS